jgi:cell division protein FtsI/penicillin-binding protein 2
MKALSYGQRIGLLLLLGTIGGGVLLSRLFVLQVVEHSDWSARAESLRSGWRPVRPARGAIVDAKGRVLAHDAAGFELAVQALGWRRVRHECVRCGAAHFLAKDADIPRRCRRCRAASVIIEENGTRVVRIVNADRRSLVPVARLLKMPVSELEARIEKRVRRIEERIQRKLGDMKPGRKRRMLEREYWYDYGRRPQAIRREVPYEVAREVALRPDRNPAFVILTSHSRVYPGGAPFVHLLGRTRESAESMEVVHQGKAHDVPTRVGASGLEYHFDAALQGTPGWVETERDLRRRERKIVDERIARTGETLRLTIDSRDQEAAYRSLRNAEGALVVVNARTGAVLALATAPSYEPGDYSATWTEWVALEKRVGAARVYGSPLPERAYRSFHTPGSILKPFTGLAAIGSGEGRFDEVIVCEKTFTYHGRSMGNRLRCNSTHGPITMRQALARSCNVYFQTLLARMMDNEHYPRFVAAGRRFGFGQRTGIEAERRAGTPGNWSFRGQYPGVLIQSAIGQGRILLSPAQVARAYAGLATGRLPSLRVVARIGDTPTVPSHEDLGLDAAELRRVQDALRAVPRAGGSAEDTDLERWGVACKTGTAQISSTRRIYNAWMAGFAPARGSRPPIAFAIVVLRSELGGAAACGSRLEQFLEHFYTEGGQ